MKVLYVGSGKSAIGIADADLSDFIVVCVNNAHKLFTDKKIDYWIFSGDYTGEKPLPEKCKYITYKEYEPAIKKLINTPSAVFDVGYTIFLQGLYWIMSELRPEEVYLAGFDHDYPKETLLEWEKFGKPTPQNKIRLNEWNALQKNTNAFYGPSTPDPLRFGLGYLVNKFDLAKKNSENLGVKIFNASNCENSLLPFKRKSIRKLTIGFVVYDDWDGLYFSLQSIRMYHKEVLNKIEFVVINTNPNSEQGKQVSKFCNSGSIREPIQYIELDNSLGGFTKGKVFSYAKTPYVLVMDCHCLLESGSLSALIGFFDSELDKGGLVQGPMLWDDTISVSNSLKREWGSGMLGKWETIKNEQPYFKINAQGMGLFACRKDSWLGFTSGNSGFGGEEYCLHDKYKEKGKPIFCLSSLKWLHRFGRPNGIPYPNKWEDRVKNYFRSYLELDKPVFEIIEHFKSVGVGENNIREWLSDVIKENE